MKNNIFLMYSGHKYICYNNNRKCWNLNIRVNGKQIQKKLTI